MSNIPCDQYSRFMFGELSGYLREIGSKDKGYLLLTFDTTSLDYAHNSVKGMLGSTAPLVISLRDDITVVKEMVMVEAKADNYMNDCRYEINLKLLNALQIRLNHNSVNTLQEALIVANLRFKLGGGEYSNHLFQEPHYTAYEMENLYDLHSMESMRKNIMKREQRGLRL